jgi:hypothetical protein
MARYILIDNGSGFIWGDSADLDGKPFAGTALDFAAALDRQVDPSAAADRAYVAESRADGANVTGYHVYRADWDAEPGKPPFPVVRDGQSQAEITAVTLDCLYQGFIRVVPRDGLYEYDLHAAYPNAMGRRDEPAGAEKEGREAFHQGILEEANPYPDIRATSGPTEDYVLWAIGWRKAAAGIIA